MAPRTKQARVDGLVNVISGLGVAGRDKSLANAFVFNTPLGPGELDEAYRSSGIARRLIDLPVLEMTREWFKVQGDDDDLVIGDLESMKARATIVEALTTADLYGGSLVVMGLDDGIADLAQPVNVEALREVSFLTVYDRHQVTWTTADLYANPTTRKYNTPEWYTIQPYHNVVSIQGQPLGSFRVHETRVLRFNGACLPPRLRRSNNGWDDSVLQACFDQLRNLCAAQAHSANIVEEWAIGVIVIKNLINLLAAKGGEDKVRQRLEIIDYSKSMLHSMLLADGESFEKKVASVSGLPELLDRFALALSAARGIPVSLLMGEAPAGLNATGEYNQKTWYDQVRAWQEAKLQPQLETLVEYEFLSKQGPTNGVEPDNWKIEFCPLSQTDPKEEAQIHKTTAETDVLYVNAGVLTPEEVAISRFGGDRYSTETEIDVAQHQPPTEQELAAEEAAKQAALANLAAANGGAVQ
jgi:hypothetical protein